MRSSSSSQRSSEQRSQTNKSSYSRVLSTSSSLASSSSSTNSSSSASGGGGAPALQTRRFHDPIPPRVRISASASKRAAIYLVGPLEALIAILENNEEEAVALVPLKNIEQMFVETINGGYWMTVQGGNWTDPKAKFKVSEDSPFYVSKKGRLERIKSVLPSKATTMKTAGDRAVYKEILLDLKQQHPDWYIVGMLYGGSEGGDIMPYLHSKMGNMAESNTDLVVKGVGHRVNIKLSAAKEAELSSNIGLGFGHHKDKVTHEYKEVVHNIVVQLLRKEDYSCIKKQVATTTPSPALPPTSTPPLTTTMMLEVSSSTATHLLEDEVAVGAAGAVGEVAGDTEASASLAAPPGLAIGLPPLGYFMGLRR
jgi:hypothetical protein